MTTKLDSKLLKQLILEELSELKESADVDPRAHLAQKMAKAGASDIPGFETGMRGELVQLFMDLLGPKADEKEVDDVASTIASLLPLLKDKGGMKEGVDNFTLENLKLVYDVLVKMSPMLAGLAIGTPLMAELLKRIQGGGMDEVLDNDMFEEEAEKYLEESLYYGLIEGDEEFLDEKKKKKGCKPAKGKKYARRVKGKCVSYGAKGYKIAPGTSKGNSYCARSYGDMKSHGKDCSGKDRSTPLCLSRKKWKCSGKYSRKGK